MFDIPADSHQATTGCRKRYFKVYGHEWPFCDTYLRQLAKLVPAESEPGFGRCLFLLLLMRERHVFEETQPRQ